MSDQSGAVEEKKEEEEIPPQETSVKEEKEEDKDESESSSEDGLPVREIKHTGTQVMASSLWFRILMAKHEISSSISSRPTET